MTLEDVHGILTERQHRGHRLLPPQDGDQLYTAFSRWYRRR